MNIYKSVMLLLACALCAGLAKAQVAGTPYIPGCPAPDAPGTITFSQVMPIVVDQDGTFTATVPNVAGMTYTWTLPAGLTGSSTTNSITITGAAAGTYDASAISVTATNSCGATSAATAGSGSITVSPDCTLIGGTCWAFSNVDAPGTFAANIGDFGMFYAWDTKIGWSTTDPLTSNPAGQTWISPPGGSSATAWDMTNNNPCPTGWRVPTDAELTALNNAGNVYITGAQATSLGIGSNAGNIFGVTTFPAAFSKSTMVFLPAAGDRSATYATLYTNIGYYWSSIAYFNAAWRLYFNTAGVTQVTYVDKANGGSVRCVQ